ncbi:MAG: hypothetical protein A3I88_01435 [Candidatus Portnoybacteria bacterium RIFCSPLOWO2_12_FULL_39_9]|uniref:DNA polymerase III subunit alpha n=1 Tax=Candidatus Portnoybacteria bacterium RIFCSPHIGHO2_12_FULL_38_9 TaxID=1801997 RepID=A0A1G2FH12_9BACT|nr:MAG: hypothetical protein A2646_03455 [Candidatus Portnoybacteria bacterium RIFCSPHIGHO2_02_FULL_39_12]OGZ36878.1 MAG: hypothetical protein A3J64_03510 [Candidatus Portnoybacteria bacterium RIFCSPHIGHO2_12_FULL_38_9]OGZ40561.1 MAG: hypothetical protein A3I88_01435 [Candidatus Portnoybacteria bacterium RIFCSPLOWO2_12_FULL_39_9]
MKFTHLHVHSHYSLLDGLSKIDQLLDYCHELKMSSIALTDHGSMYGAVEFFQKAKKRGLKPIIGSEMYLAPNGRRLRRPNIDDKRYHLILLVKNKEGYRNLVQLTTKAYLEGFYYKPRIDKELLKKHSAGLIGLTACLSGEIPKLIINNQIEEAEKTALEYQEIFGPANFYLELEHHPNLELQALVNQTLIKIAKKYKIPLVATNDVHYLKPQDAEAQDVLMAINTDKKATDENRLTMKNSDFSLKSPEEMMEWFKDAPEAISNTQKIVEQCDFEFELGKIQFPHFEVPNGQTPDEFLKNLCFQGLKKRYPNISKEILDRLNYELSVIKETNLASYFLIVQDFVNWAKSKNIVVGPGRGSASGSLVSYLLNITDVDPLKYNLLFERFLNPDRIEMPDIDLDFADDRRDEVINYVKNKYGENHMAQIITFGTMAARAAVRDVGRALNYPYSFCDQIAKMIPFGLPLEKAIYESQELHQVYESDETAKKLIDMARKLEGVARHASTHAAGVVITKDNIDNLVPRQHPTQDDQTIITQYEMNSIGALGLLKMDFLGLKTLTVIQNSLNQIKEGLGQGIDLGNIPLNDKKTFKLFQEANTTGVFQLESGGMKRYLKQLKPTQFEDIMAMVALYRPGPMELIPEFIARKHGQKKIQYLHPKLKPILENTYGICITGDSILQETNPGGILRIDEAVNSSKKIYVQSWNGKKFVKRKVINKFNNGTKNVYKIKLRTGKEIKATADHQFLTIQGWKKLSDIKKGDFIATPKKIISGKKEFNKEKLKVLAYLIADGALSNHNACYFVNKDDVLLNDFKKCADSFNNLKITFSKHIRNVKRANPSKKINTVYHQPNSILHWLRKLGLKDKKGGKKSIDKFVPRFIFELNDQCISVFLAALWDCDGGVSPKSAYLTTISKKLAYDIQTLLLKLTINSYIYQGEKYKTQNGQITQVYRIIIYDLKDFYKKIGWLMITDKQKILKGYLKKIKGTCKEFVPREPFLKRIIKYQKINNVSQRALEKLLKMGRKGFFGKKERKKRRLNLELAKKIADFIQNSALKKICDEKYIRWEDVISIKHAGIEPVYDIEIERTHNFVANNIITHNCVYQEQLMRIARDLAGFTLAEADVLRKAVGKKIKKLLDEQKEKMIKGMVKNEIEPETAERIWQFIEPFARYGFNRAHSCCYAMIGYWTAYLKALYPAEFMASLMTSEQNDIERIAFLVNECRQMHLKVLPPDINESDENFTVVSNQQIRFGLKAIKNVGHNVVKTIVSERKDFGPFKSMTDFIERIAAKDAAAGGQSILNKKSMESLIKCGAFDKFSERNQLLTSLEQILYLVREIQKTKKSGQISLFQNQPSIETSSFKLQEATAADRKVCLAWEKELLGLYISQHPMEDFKERLKNITIPCQTLSNQTNNRLITIGGIINKIQKINTRTGQPMLFVEVEDLSGRIEVLVFPRVLEQTAAAWQEEKVVLVRGRLSDRGNKLNLLCDSVKVIE